MARRAVWTRVCTGVVWSDLTSLPRKAWRSLQPTKGKQAARGGCFDVRSSENPVGASEEGKNCSLHFLLFEISHAMKQVAVRKGEV